MPITNKQTRNSGFGMMEMLLSTVVITIALLSMGQFLVVTISSGNTNSYRVEVLNHVRAKIEEVKAIPYDQLGIVPDGGTSGPGYYETDPFYNPTFGDDDTLLSDSVELSRDGTTTRTVTIQSVDDAADGTGQGDWDQVIGPNTNSILDYKVVTVSVDATDPVDGSTFTTELSTIVVGSLDTELDAAGTDDIAQTAIKTKKAKKEKSKKKGSVKSDHKTDKAAKNKKGRKAREDDTDTDTTSDTGWTGGWWGGWSGSDDDD